MNPNGALITIRKKGSPWRKRVEALQQRPIAPYYFLIGVLIGMLGITYLGVHLWLMREGVIPVSENYLAFRKLHAILQIHGFFGAFISGFTLQALPRLMGSQQIRPPWTTALLPLFVLSIALLLLLPESRAGRILFGVHFFALLAVVLWYAAQSKRAAKIHVAPFFVIGLTTLVIGTMTDLGDPRLSFVILWLGILPIVSGALHIFERLVGKKQFSSGESLALCSIYVVAGLLSYLSSRGEILPWKLSWIAIDATLALSSFLLIRAYVQGLRAAPPISLPIATACWIGTFWLVVTTLVLPYAGPHLADIPLHLLATGFAFPIVLAFSSQIVGALSNSTILKPRTLYLLLALWQLVPISRGLGSYLPQWEPLTWLASISATVVIWIWAFAISAKVWRLTVKRGETRRENLSS